MDEYKDFFYKINLGKRIAIVLQIINFLNCVWFKDNVFVFKFIEMLLEVVKYNNNLYIFLFFLQV